MIVRLWYAKLSVLLVPGLLLMLPLSAQADDRTDPYATPHVETGEPGVWIPLWLQQVHLQTDAKLQTCVESSNKDRQALAERSEEATTASQAAEELREANTSLQRSLEASEAAHAQQQDDAETRLVWAWTSTGAATVAISVLVLVLVN